VFGAVHPVYFPFLCMSANPDLLNKIKIGTEIRVAVICEQKWDPKKVTFKKGLKHDKVCTRDQHPLSNFSRRLLLLNSLYIIHVGETRFVGETRYVRETRFPNRTCWQLKYTKSL